MRLFEKLSTATHVLRAEGAAAVVNRALDLWEMRRRERQARPLTTEVSFARAWPETPAPTVLNVLSTPFGPFRGGVQRQLADRIDAEAASRAIAFLSPSPSGWRLEWRTRRGTSVLPIPGTTTESAASIRLAADLSQTRVVHIEGLFGLEPGTISELAKYSLHVALSIHDFSAFCRRPHLLQRPELRFCDLCRDPARCLTCLRHDWPLLRPEDHATYRETRESDLTASAVRIYPSSWLQQRHAEAFPSVASKPSVVVEPATRARSVPSVRLPWAFDVAFVGGAKKVKGGLLVSTTMAALHSHDPHLRCAVLGECEPDLAHQLRTSTPEVRILGYYRTGTLTQLLRRSGARVAVLPSIVPESYGLVVDECLAAGVPVVAFDHGAVGERLRRWKLSGAVPLAQGAAGLATVALDQLTIGTPAGRRGIDALLPTPESAAAAMLGLYRAFGWK